ncbi:hypothetical protein BTVI_122450 [Pitangus sulphuratus]|nr:hypothetical protein BTVI_122450 [Pitangus sulphuratus]
MDRAQNSVPRLELMDPSQNSVPRLELMDRAQSSVPRLDLGLELMDPIHKALCQGWRWWILCGGSMPRLELMDPAQNSAPGLELGLELELVDPAPDSAEAGRGRPDSALLNDAVIWERALQSAGRRVQQPSGTAPPLAGLGRAALAFISSSEFYCCNYEAVNCTKAGSGGGEQP